MTTAIKENGNSQINSDKDNLIISTGWLHPTVDSLAWRRLKGEKYLCSKGQNRGTPSPLEGFESKQESKNRWSNPPRNRLKLRIALYFLSLFAPQVPMLSADKPTNRKLCVTSLWTWLKKGKGSRIKSMSGRTPPKRIAHRQIPLVVFPTR